MAGHVNEPQAVLLHTDTDVSVLWLDNNSKYCFANRLANIDSPTLFSIDSRVFIIIILSTNQFFKICYVHQVSAPTFDFVDAKSQQLI